MQKVINLFIAFVCLTAFNSFSQTNTDKFFIDTSDQHFYKIKFYPQSASSYRWGMYHKSDISKTHARFIESKINYTTDSTFDFDYRDSLGTHWICLESTDSRGLKDTSCKKIRAYFQTIRYPINPFFPGKDSTGKEKVFHFTGYQYAKYKFWIYDRWGQKLYESTDPEKGWNGKVLNTGADCPDGTYYYILEYSHVDSPDMVTKTNGTLSLFR